jgi:Ni/Co efflux regulator RcnB
MRSMLIIVGVVAALAAPAAAPATGPHVRQHAAKECKAERADDPAAFQKKYGTNHNGRNAFGKCVSQKAKDFKNAARDRAAEREEAG